MYQDKPIVLYEYQPSRNADHPRVFLKDFQGICVTDGYQVYHTLEKEREDLRIAGCWAHARRRFDEALQALPKDQQKDTIAYFALKQIQAIYREENKLVCFVNRKSSKSEGKFPTFRSGNPQYPKETCREFSFFSLSSRKESSIHCFLPNRVIRVRLCQRLPERFAFNVLSFDSAPAPG